MKLVWTAIVVMCLAGAAMALWRQRLDAAFVIATIGILAWFLRYRSELKESVLVSDSRRLDEAGSEVTDENS